MEEAEERTLSDDKWVMIMADYGSDGVWDRNGVGVCADELPVSPALKACLAARMKRWEDHSPFDSETYHRDHTGLKTEVMSIVEAIRAELPGWTVTYR